MRVSSKSFKGLDSHVKSRVARMNRQIAYNRAQNSKVENYYTTHGAYGRPLRGENDDRETEHAVDGD